MSGSRLRPKDAPEVVAELEALSRESHLARSPTLVRDPLNLGVDDLAIGRYGRYYVRLTAGLVKHYHTNRLGFRAVVRCELAHLRNGDVDRLSFVMALWWTFVALSLLTALIETVGFARLS